MRIACDFDLTIAITEWPDIVAPVPRAAESLRKLKAQGHHITIWSARNNKQWGRSERNRSLRDMRQYLEDNHVPYDDIDTGDHGKPLVRVFIDDRSLGIPLIRIRGHWVVDWTKAYQMVQSLSR
jgi:hypothetical protein